MVKKNAAVVFSVILLVVLLSGQNESKKGASIGEYYWSANSNACRLYTSFDGTGYLSQPAPEYTTQTSCLAANGGGGSSTCTFNYLTTAYCAQNKVYRDFQDTSCNIGAELIDTCTSSEVCSGGDCISSTQSACDLINSFPSYSNCQKVSGGVCSGDDKYYCANGYVYTATTSVPTNSGATVIYLCELNGVVGGASVINCANGCSNGECQTQICSPNQQWCDGNQVKQCTSDGKTISLKSTCSNTQVCQTNTGSSASCVFTSSLYCRTSTGDTTSPTCYLWSGDGPQPDKCFATQPLCETVYNYRCQDTHKIYSVSNTGALTQLGTCSAGMVCGSNGIAKERQSTSDNALTLEYLQGIDGALCTNVTAGGAGTWGPTPNAYACGQVFQQTNSVSGSQRSTIGIACAEGTCDTVSGECVVEGEEFDFNFNKYLPWIIIFFVGIIGLKMLKKP